MTASANATNGSAPDGWTHARLIPTYGIRDQQEQEKRATSCLLAVMHGVPEFGHALLRELGAPKSPVIETYAEVRFKDADRKTVIPDGAIRCQRADKAWTCLVEVKTGSASLKEDQVSAYLDIAKTNGYDGVLTISSQITASSQDSPVKVDGRRLSKKLCLWHFSWSRILTEAIVQLRYRGIADADQEWVLRELIHYLSSPASGAAGFEDMGANWVQVRNAARDGSLRKESPAAKDVAERWEQFAQHLCLSLTRELGAAVTVQRLPPDQTAGARLEELVQALEKEAVLTSTVRVPDAVGPLTIRADLRSRQTFVSVSIDAPREGGPKRRFNWLINQLKHAPDDLMIKASFANVHGTTAVRLGEVRDDPSSGFYAADVKKEPRGFVLTQARPMGQKRGREEGSFVRETSTQTVTFYRDIVQHLKAWRPSAPRLRTDSEQTVVAIKMVDAEPVTAATTEVLASDLMEPTTVVES
jgi:hypothetical protein